MLTLCTKTPSSLNGVRCQAASEGSLSGSLIIWGHWDFPGNISGGYWSCYCGVSVFPVIHLFHEVFVGLFSNLAWLFCQTLHLGEIPMPGAVPASPHPNPVC